MKHYNIDIASKEIVDKVNHTVLYTYNVYRVFLGFIYIPVYSVSNEKASSAYDACVDWVKNKLNQ